MGSTCRPTRSATSREVLHAAGKTSEAAGAFDEALDRYERKKNLAMARRVRARLGTYDAATV